MFKSEDEYEEIEDFSYDEEYDERNINTRNNHPDGKGNLDTKVFYQYPKGQFKFPLIPDESKEESEKISSNRKQIHHPPRSGLSDHGDEQIANKRREQSIPLSSKKEIEVVIHNRRPFRPTEIPSPIYGYNRPVRKAKERQEIVEFELHAFTEKDDELVKKNVQPIQVEQILAEEKLDMQENNNVVDESLTSDLEMTQLKGTGHKDVPSKEEEEVVSAFDSSPFVAAAMELDSTDEGSSIEDKFDFPSELDITDVETNADEIELQAEAMMEYETIETNIEEGMEVEKAAIKGNDDPQESSISVHTMDEEKTSMEDSENEVIIADDHSSSNDEFLDKESKEEEKRNKHRSHLPFNVIMLKQDKRKIDHSLMTNEKKPSVSSSSETEECHTKTVEQNPSSEIQEYKFPATELLTPPAVTDVSDEWLNEQEQFLNETLMNFNVGAKVVNVTQGPAVTRFEVQPDPGVKVNKITNLSDDIKLSLAAKDIRIEAPIPGKHTIGIEVPNQKSRPVFISEIINSHVFKQEESPLTAVLGLDISGKPIVTDLRKMPHGLIAGATGSGKSVCINSILVSLLYKATPDDLKLLLIDPKMVELAPYNQIPHLVSPVITDVKAATAALKWAVDEMERRYELFAHTGVRDITRFNELAENHQRYADKLPYIVIIIDELADLMMMSPADVEEAICRIAQKARACGIHLIIATQRPSVDVITGLIKANVPTRIAFSVSSQIDSRTIIDIGGAEKLLGRGDMLFLENGTSKPVRLQGTFVSDTEIDDVVQHVREQQEPDYLFHQEELIKKAQITEEEDELFYEACEFVVDQGGASTSGIQRRFKIGYNRAARLIDMMEQQGFISEARGSKPRDVLITEAELESIQDSNAMF